MDINITVGNITRAALEHSGVQPLKGRVKEHEILKPHALQALPINFPRHPGSLIGAGDVAEIEKRVQHLPETSAALIKIRGVFDFRRRPFADPDNAGEITGENDPVDEM